MSRILTTAEVGTDLRAIMDGNGIFSGDVEVAARRILDSHVLLEEEVARLSRKLEKKK